MQPNPVNTPGESSGNRGLIRPYQALTAVSAFVVLLQAALAGQGWFKGDQDFINVHEIVANVFFLVIVLQLFLTWLIRKPDLFSKRLLVANVLLMALTFTQIGLGYAGRETAQAAAWHIPNGVLMFGLAVAIASFASRLPAD